MSLNLPFELAADPGVPRRGRFLLLHGLNDSPYVWRGLARELAARGFDVRATLFEGHGSTPRDMLHVRMERWFEAARAELDDWAGTDGGPIWIGGFSMGAVVATRLALDASRAAAADAAAGPAVAGLLLVSPAFRSGLDRWLRFAGAWRRFRPWVFGQMILEDNPIKYNSIPVNSGWQFRRATRSLARAWRRGERIEVPALVVQSIDDSVVDTVHTAALFDARFAHPASRLVTLAADPPVDDGRDVPAVPTCARCDSLQARFPADRVLNQSHLGIMYPPDDPLFGRAGRVLACNGNEFPIFAACMRSPRHWYGAQHTGSPDGTPVARTTFHPGWDAVLERLDRTLAAGTR